MLQATLLLVLTLFVTGLTLSHIASHHSQTRSPISPLLDRPAQHPHILHDHDPHLEWLYLRPNIGPDKPKGGDPFDDLLPSTFPDSDFDTPSPSVQFFPPGHPNHLEARQDEQPVIAPPSVVTQTAIVGPKPPSVPASDPADPLQPPTVSDPQPASIVPAQPSPSPAESTMTAIPPPAQTSVSPVVEPTPPAITPSTIILPPATPTGVQDPLVVPDLTPSPTPVPDDSLGIPSVTTPSVTPPVSQPVPTPPASESVPAPPVAIPPGAEGASPVPPELSEDPAPFPTAIVPVDSERLPTPAFVESPSPSAVSDLPTPSAVPAASVSPSLPESASPLPKPPTVQNPDTAPSPVETSAPVQAPTVTPAQSPQEDITPTPPSLPIVSQDGYTCLYFGKGDVLDFETPDEGAFTGDIGRIAVSSADFPELPPQYLSHTLGQNWTYSTSAEMGIYEIVLGFAEIFSPICSAPPNSGLRLFSVMVPGQSVTIDVFASVGCGAVLETSFDNVVPADGEITLSMEGITGRAMLSTMCYRKTSSVVPPSLMTPSASPSPVPVPVTPVPIDPEQSPDLEEPEDTPLPPPAVPDRTPPPASLEEIQAAPTTGFQCLNFGPNVGNGYFPYDPEAVAGKAKVYEGIRFGDFPNIPAAYRFHAFGKAWNYTLDVSTSEPQTVALGFAEVFPEACESDIDSGFRVFSVTVAGITQVVDVFKSVGCGKVHQISFANVTPRNGVIKISFFSISEKSMVSVICSGDTRTTKFGRPDPIVSPSLTAIPGHNTDAVEEDEPDSPLQTIGEESGDDVCFQFSGKTVPGYVTALVGQNSHPVNLYNGPTDLIEGTSLSKVYSSHIYGSRFTLSFNTVDDLPRTIVLGFAEVFEPACKEGFRIFEVEAGSTVRRIDVFREVGCQALFELTLEDVSPSADGIIHISFSAVRNSAMVSSICVASAVGEDGASKSPQTTTISISPMAPDLMGPDLDTSSDTPEAVIKPLKPISDLESLTSSPTAEPNAVFEESDNDDVVVLSPLPVDSSDSEPISTTLEPDASTAEDDGDDNSEPNGNDEDDVETTFIGDPNQTSIPEASGTTLPKENGVILSLPEPDIVSPEPSQPVAIHGDDDESIIEDTIIVSPEFSDDSGLVSAEPLFSVDPTPVEVPDTLPLPTVTPTAMALPPLPENPTEIIPDESGFEPLPTATTDGPVAILPEVPAEVSPVIEGGGAVLPSPENEADFDESPTALLPVDSLDVSPSESPEPVASDTVEGVTAIPPGSGSPPLGENNVIGNDTGSPNNTDTNDSTGDKESSSDVEAEPTEKSPRETEVVVTIVINGDQVSPPLPSESPDVPFVATPPVAIMPSPDMTPPADETASSDVTLEMPDDPAEQPNGDAIGTPVVEPPPLSPTITPVPEVPAASTAPVPDSGSPDLELQDVPTVTPTPGDSEPISPGGVVIGSASPVPGGSAPTLPIVEPSASQSPMPVVSSVTGGTDVIVINPSPVSGASIQPSPVPVAPPADVIDVPDSDTGVIEVPGTREPDADGGVVVDIPDGADVGEANGAGAGATIDGGSNLSISASPNNRGFSIGMGILGALLILLLLTCLFFAIFRSGGGTYTYSSQYSAHRPTEYDGSSQAPYTDELLPEAAGGQRDYGNGRPYSGSGGNTFETRPQSNSFGYGSQGDRPADEHVPYEGEGGVEPDQYATYDSANEGDQQRYGRSSGPTTGDYTYSATYGVPPPAGLSGGIRDSGYDEYNEADQRGSGIPSGAGTERLSSFNEYRPVARPVHRESGLGGKQERYGAAYQVTPPESPTVFSDPQNRNDGALHPISSARGQEHMPVVMAAEGITRHYDGDEQRQERYTDMNTEYANQLSSDVQSAEPSYAPSTRDAAVSERPGTELSESSLYDENARRSVLQPHIGVQEAAGDYRQSQMSNDGPWPQWWGRNHSGATEQHFIDEGHTSRYSRSYQEPSRDDAEAKENAPYMNLFDVGRAGRMSSGQKNTLEAQQEFGNEAVTLEGRNLPMTLSQVDSHWIRSTGNTNGTEGVEFEGALGDEYEELRKRREPYVKSVASRISVRGPVDSTNQESFIEARKDIARELAEEAAASWAAQRAIDV